MSPATSVDPAGTTRVVATRAELRRERAALAGRVAVVMTMGALHDGHAELVRHAHKWADSVVVTIFVNPLQFGEAADLERYPRRLAADVALCEELGVDLVFAPGVEEVYPDGTPTVTVHGGRLAAHYEGADRPGHFDGMLTVVAKLLRLTAPDVAVFGEKDAQQLALIRAMNRDLDLGVEIVGVRTVREPDGLALSSRNARLTPDQRVDALALSRALYAGAAARTDGPEAVLAAAQRVIEASAVDPSYLVLVDDLSWHLAGPATTRARLLVAARVGEVRLIDNVPVRLTPADDLDEPVGS